MVPKFCIYCGRPLVRIGPAAFYCEPCDQTISNGRDCSFAATGERDARSVPQAPNPPRNLQRDGNSEHPDAQSGSGV